MADRQVYRMAQKETYALGKIIDAHCVGDEKNEIAEYEEGWSDIRVLEAAHALGGNMRYVNIDHVKRMRLQMMGRLPTAELTNTAVLQQRIKALEEWAAARPVEPFKPLP